MQYGSVVNNLCDVSMKQIFQIFIIAIINKHQDLKAIIKGNNRRYKVAYTVIGVNRVVLVYFG